MFKEFFVLSCDLHSISGKLLIEMGEPFDFTKLEDLCLIEGRFSLPIRVDKTFIIKDLFIQTKSDPYKDIVEKVGEDIILEILGKILLPYNIIEEFHFLKIKDDYTYKHSFNTALLTAAMACQFFDDRQKIFQVVSSAFTHDIGKSRIPSKILHATMPLSSKEFEIVKEHSLYGCVLCSYYLGSPYCPNAITALQHHEKINGRGYPLGIHLKDSDVMFVIVSDIFDALISKRPYRSEPYDVRGAIDILCQSVEQGEIEEEKLKMLIHLNRKSPPPLKEIKYSQLYRGYYPKINYYGIRKSFYTT